MTQTEHHHLFSNILDVLGASRRWGPAPHPREGTKARFWGDPWSVTLAGSLRTSLGLGPPRVVLGTAEPRGCGRPAPCPLDAQGGTPPQGTAQLHDRRIPPGHPSPEARRGVRCTQGGAGRGGLRLHRVVFLPGVSGPRPRAPVAGPGVEEGLGVQLQALVGCVRASTCAGLPVRGCLLLWRVPSGCAPGGLGLSCPGPQEPLVHPPWASGGPLADWGGGRTDKVAQCGLIHLSIRPPLTEPPTQSLLAVGPELRGLSLTRQGAWERLHLTQL